MNEGHRPDSCPPREPLRVFIADDDRDAADSLGMLCELHGCEVAVFHDGESAIAAAEAASELGLSPDLLLLDLAMPTLDGCATLQGILEATGHDRAISACITGNFDARSRDRCAMAGFVYYCLKPLDVRQLEYLIQRARQARDGGFRSPGPSLAQANANSGAARALVQLRCSDWVGA